MWKWTLASTLAKPPHGTRIPKKMAYLRHYTIGMAHIHPLGKSESPTTFKKRMYEILYAMTIAERGTPNMRITLKQPTTSWAHVWNLHHAPIWQPKINMVHSHTWNSSHKWMASGCPPSWHRQLHPLWKDWYTTTQNHVVRRRSSNMELDTDKDSDPALHKPLPHDGRLDNASNISLLASSETRWHCMDNSALGGVQGATTEVTLPPRLHRFLRSARRKAYQQTPRQRATGYYLDILV